MSDRPGLYLMLLSVHGLVRGDAMELGRDADTGGQVTYVVELARALARRPEVARVDLVTRRIVDPRYDRAYAEPPSGSIARAWEEIVRSPDVVPRLGERLHRWLDEAVRDLARLELLLGDRLLLPRPRIVGSRPGRPPGFRCWRRPR